MQIQGNPAALRSAMEQVSGKALEKLSDAEKTSALQQVAQNEGVKPAALLTDLQAAFPDVFGGGGNALEQLGAAGRYSAAAGQMSQTGRTVGTRLAAMAGGGIVANEGAIQDFFAAPDAAAIRDKAGKYGEMTEAYAQLTANQLFDELTVPPRVQTVAQKALADVAKKTASAFTPDGFRVSDDARLGALALGQHAGYVAGELGRHHGVDEPQARAALIEYFHNGGDVDKLIADAGLPPKTDGDFWNNNGWMFAGGFDDRGDWGFWGFGDTNQALNRPGVHAGEATLDVAEALDKGNGERLLASTLAKDPSQWNDNEKVVGNFALRAAQLGWLSSKLGQGIVEAHNPKKEHKAAGRWAPGNDLITDFNSMREAKGWNEVAKDLDQIKSFAVSSGILNPQGEATGDRSVAAQAGAHLDNAQYASLFAGPLSADRLAPLTDHLVGGARDALVAQSFSQRTQMMADVVGDEGGLLAARSAGLPVEDAPKVQQVFREAARMAGRAFGKAFDADGNKRPDREAAYKSAMSEAGKWAFDGIDDLSRAMGGDAGFRSSDSERIVKGARLEDVAAIVANDLGLPESVTQMDGAALKAMIADVVPSDDYFHKDIAGMPVRAADDDPLSEQDQRVLSMGIRLANATWKSGQVHRAAWEGKDDRINPGKRTAFNTFDALKGNMFEQATGGDTSVKAQREGFARVVFEVYKDLLQLQKAAGD